MLFAKKAALTLTALATPIFAADGHTEYYTDLGKYGTFELAISADKGTMTWQSELANIDELTVELGIVGGIQQLNYHLHSFWTLDVNYATGGTDCGSGNTGGHYDPFFACGPASGVPNATCIAIGHPQDPAFYKCSPEQYEAEEYDDCEVGDLSGKDGPLIVDSNGNASGKSSFPDPMAALNAQYVDERVSAPFDKWGSIVFHNGSPRVLCAKIFKKPQPVCKVEFILYNADSDEPVGPLEAQETSMPNQFNIRARPTAGCDPTESAKLNLDGPIVVQDHTENLEPYMVFGDHYTEGNIYGRDYDPGFYTISAEFYTNNSLQGELVVSGEFEFEIIPAATTFPVPGPPISAPTLAPVPGQVPTLAPVPAATTFPVPGPPISAPTPAPFPDSSRYGTWYFDETTTESCDSLCSQNGGLLCNSVTAHPLVDTEDKLRYVVEVELGKVPGLPFAPSDPSDPNSDLNPQVDLFNNIVAYNSSDPVNGPMPSCSGLDENFSQRICCCVPAQFPGMVCQVEPP